MVILGTHYEEQSWEGRQLMDLRYLRDKLADDLRQEAHWYEVEDDDVPLTQAVDWIVEQTRPESGKRALLARFDPEQEFTTSGNKVVVLVKLSRLIAKIERDEYERLLGYGEEAFAA